MTTGLGAGIGTRRMADFDIAAPLPTGTVLLEASAGTGKTWTIAALVARYVAEGAARLEEMLIITFGLAEQSVFDEIDQDKIDRVRGFDITVVTTAKTDDEGRALLRALGFPFKAEYARNLAAHRRQ